MISKQMQWINPIKQDYNVPNNQNILIIWNIFVILQKTKSNEKKNKQIPFRMEE